MSFTKVEVLNYLKKNYDENNYNIAYKISKVKFRDGILGDKIVTKTFNGIIETINTVKADNVVLTNMGNEQYVLSKINFNNRYEKISEDSLYYKPKYNLVLVVELKENISFIAKWGEIMRIKAGGCLIVHNEADIYGVQKEEFLSIYKLIKPIIKKQL